MTAHLVTFSDESMSRAAQLCIESATRVGNVDGSLRWHYEDLKQTRFYADNVDILSQPRGLGYWAWKPWIIDRAMDNHLHARQFLENSITKIEDGDILIYADAGVEFINNISCVVDHMGHEKPQDDIWLFGNNWEHAHWCKRDAAETIWPCNETSNCPRPGHYDFWDKFGKQVQASVIFFRVSDYTRQFVAEWLKWCLFEGGRLIDDSPSRAPNHPEFREHRHDQAILTTMAYREGIKLHYWPATYNDGAFNYEKLPEYARDDYPILFHHHRRRDHEWQK
jgi:hypothetical protein